MKTKKCPFCGGKELAFNIVSFHHGCMECVKCDARGPVVSGDGVEELEKTARKAWNGKGVAKEVK